MSVYVFIFSKSGRKEWRLGTRLRGLRDVTQNSPDVKMHSQVEGECTCNRWKLLQKMPPKHLLLLLLQLFREVNELRF